jgi:hypothetical protein
MLASACEAETPQASRELSKDVTERQKSIILESKRESA